MIFFPKNMIPWISNINPGLTRVIEQFLVCLYTGESLYMRQLLCLKIFTGICVSWPLALALALEPSSGPNLYLAGSALICMYRSGPKSVFTSLYLSICIYRPWLIRIGNNKSQRVHIMLVLFFCFFLLTRWKLNKK